MGVTKVGRYYKKEQRIHLQTILTASFLLIGSIIAVLDSITKFASVNTLR